MMALTVGSLSHRNDVRGHRAMDERHRWLLHESQGGLASHAYLHIVSIKILVQGQEDGKNKMKDHMTLNILMPC